MSYSESEEYQKEIREQYQKRNLQLKEEEVKDILGKLGFSVSVDDISVAEAGNMNATFLAGGYVVKINKEEGVTKYAANVIVSENLKESSVVRVITHDEYKKTDYEVLVMERALGEEWLKKMPEMSEEENKHIFSQVLDVMNEFSDIDCTDKFGWITDIQTDSEKNGFNSFREQLEERLNSYLTKLRKNPENDINAIDKIEQYILDNLSLFDTDKPSFVHSDLHMGNVMQEKGELTAIIDFDSVQSVPKYTVLLSLIGLIDNPGQYVEGTDDFPKYKDKKFEYLYPILKEKIPEIFEEQNLGLKLNILGILEGLMWASDDWSKDWTKEMIENLSTKEIPEGSDYSKTYYIPIIERIKALK